MLTEKQEKRLISLRNKWEVVRQGENYFHLYDLNVRPRVRLEKARKGLYMGSVYVTDENFVFEGVEFSNIKELNTAMKKYMLALPFPQELYDRSYSPYVRLHHVLHYYLTERLGLDHVPTTDGCCDTETYTVHDCGDISNLRFYLRYDALMEGGDPDSESATLYRITGRTARLELRFNGISEGLRRINGFLTSTLIPHIAAETAVIRRVIGESSVRGMEEISLNSCGTRYVSKSYVEDTIDFMEKALSEIKVLD